MENHVNPIEVVPIRFASGEWLDRLGRTQALDPYLLLVGRGDYEPHFLDSGYCQDRIASRSAV
jgi:hypothetical protein